ncbi:transposase [Streptomyces sp. ISL-99]|nr:transposase [Streptomyces sp. ISL-99]
MAVGLDLGVTVAVATSDPERPFLTHEPWLNRKEEERLRRLERKAARQRRSAAPGRSVSRRLLHTYDQISQLRGRERRRRADWQHKATTSLAEPYGLIGVERLNVKAMTASARGTTAEPGKCVRQKQGGRTQRSRWTGTQAAALATAESSTEPSGCGTTCAAAWRAPRESPRRLHNYAFFTALESATINREAPMRAAGRAGPCRATASAPGAPARP